MARLARDLTGMTFGRLTVLRPSEGRDRYWDCKCACGTTDLVQVRADRLRVDGKGTLSCGCKRIKHAQTVGGKRGMYVSWQEMKRRCDDPRHPAYPNYGGRGVRYDPRWVSFPAFYKDMGDRPPGTSLDRLDVYEGYTKANCRWADRETQANNTRRNRMYSCGSVSATARTWAMTLFMWDLDGNWTLKKFRAAVTLLGIEALVKALHPDALTVLELEDRMQKRKEEEQERKKREEEEFVPA